ncbi:MAG: trigger factor [Planctomycetia bacterium]|nr:trigger factor [Planctomycetia bacterium]
MADEHPESDELAATETAEGEGAEGGEPEEEKKQPLTLKVQIDKRSACERHVAVSVSREDIDRYFDKQFTELMPKVEVPGFRPGRAPRKLVESRFRKDVSEQVKAALLMESLEQLTEEQKLAAISEPDLDPASVELPEAGPMTFEFDIEVRPEFDLPNWKGLAIERPVHEFTEAEVEDRVAELLREKGDLHPVDGPAALGDSLAVDIEFTCQGETHGKLELGKLEEEVVRILPVLSFRDGKIEKFASVMKGVKAGETREARFTLTADAAREELRGQEVTATFKVLEVQRFSLPEMGPALFRELNVQDEAELRSLIRQGMERQLEYERQRRVRNQVTSALIATAQWDLPREMLQRQANRELQRAVMELQRAGFSDAEIQAHENELRQNSQVETARALKEHFILERLAEEEKIEEVESDYDDEIALIARQSGESARRVRAKIEKAGAMDALRNQIIERKAIELILKHAKYKDVKYELPQPRVCGVDYAVGGGQDQQEIPEARHTEAAEAPHPGKPAQS